jgi:hypothetical protein
MTTPPPNMLELPLEVRAEMAFRAAVERVIDDSVLAGLPIHIWRDGQVVEIPVEELREISARNHADDDH